MSVRFPFQARLSQRPLGAAFGSLFAGCAALSLAACDSPVVVPMPSPEAGADTTDSNDTHQHDAGDGCQNRGWFEFEDDHLLFEEAASVDAGDGGTGFELRMLEAEPNPPIVGNNSWTVEFLYEGTPLTGAEADIFVTPFMPDHNHGTPTPVSVTEISDGVYRLEPVHLRMAGYWEITLDVDAPDGERALSFGVCIE